MTADVLRSIVDATRSRIRTGGYAAAASAAPAPDGTRFVSALREPGARIIAEIKSRSPSAGEILRNCDRKVETVSLAYRRGHAAAISVVTEREFFGGDPAWIARAKKISGLPVLMKDFILEDAQLDFAASHGADAVLLIASILDEARLRALREGASRRGMAALVETHSEDEIRIASGLGAEVIGVNARDLRTFDVNLEALVSLASAIPGQSVGVAESGIRSRADLVRLQAAGYRAFLVGESLLRSDDPEETLRELRGSP